MRYSGRLISYVPKLLQKLLVCLWDTVGLVFGVPIAGDVIGISLRSLTSEN